MRVLVVDDEPEVRSLLVRALVRDGHTASEAASLRGARASLEARPVDLIVLDLGLPDGSGVELCQSLRREGNAVPVLVLTARSEIAQRVLALDAGADDFLGKPFAVAELRARVRALGRRRRHALATTTLVLGEVAVDLGARRAQRGQNAIPITPREWAILEALSGRGGRLVSRADLLDEVWGETSDKTAASLEVLVGRIRRKLGEGFVRTVRGEGYAIGALP